MPGRDFLEDKSVLQHTAIKREGAESMEQPDLQAPQPVTQSPETLVGFRRI